jgi:hypothetical protein
MSEHQEILGPREVAGIIAVGSEMPLIFLGVWWLLLLEWEFSFSLAEITVQLLGICAGVGLLGGLVGRLLCGDRPGVNPGESTGLLGAIKSIGWSLFIVGTMSISLFGMCWEWYGFSYSLLVLLVSVGATFGVYVAMVRSGVPPREERIFSGTAMGGLSLFWTAAGYYVFAALGVLAEWGARASDRTVELFDVVRALSHREQAFELLLWYLSENIGALLVVGFVAFLTVAIGVNLEEQHR